MILEILDLQAWASWLVWQSLLATVIGLPIWGLSRYLGHRKPRLLAMLWILVLGRFLVPYTWGWWQIPWASVDSAPVVVATELTSGQEYSGVQPVDRPPQEAQTETLIPIFCLWLLGSTGTLAAWVNSRLRFRAMVRSGRPLPPRYQEEAQRLCTKVGIRRKVTFVHHPEIRGGLTMGWWSPKVMIGSHLLQNDRDRPLVLAHELVHVSRFDDFWIYWEALIRSLFFFHPLVWIASRELRERREILCDHQAISVFPIRPHLYGKALLRLLNEGSLAPAQRFNPTQYRSLLMRVRALTDPPHNRNPILFSLLGLALLFSTSFTQAAPEESHNQSSTQEVPAVKLDKPLPNARITSTFGQRPDPFNGGTRHHSGVDLSGKKGDPIAAPADGDVIQLDEDPSSPQGIALLIDHGQGLQTYYAHLDSISVKLGDRVQRGETLGTVGSSGLSTGPHLHLEVRLEDETVDPATMISF